MPQHLHRASRPVQGFQSRNKIMWKASYTLGLLVPIDCVGVMPWSTRATPTQEFVSYRYSDAPTLAFVVSTGSLRVPLNDKHRYGTANARDARPRPSSRFNVNTAHERPHRQHPSMASAMGSRSGRTNGLQHLTIFEEIGWENSKRLLRMPRIDRELCMRSGRDSIGVGGKKEPSSAQLGSLELKETEEESIPQQQEAVTQTARKEDATKTATAVNSRTNSAAEAKVLKNGGTGGQNSAQQSSDSNHGDSPASATIVASGSSGLEVKGHRKQQLHVSSHNSPVSQSESLEQMEEAVTRAGREKTASDVGVYEKQSASENVFGSRGWYSPEQVEESESLFSWHGNKRMNASGAPSEKGETSADSDAQRARSSDDRREAEAKADDWSYRRRLLENWDEYDEVWVSMRKEAKAAAEKEPLLVSFIYSTILNQKTLEAAVAFHLANKLAGPNMLSTQIQALVRECFSEVGDTFRRQLRRDIIAVRERDPACESYHDCLLYFKGFQALQTHRVAHWLYHSGRHALAFYLQSQVNQEFQIDIHPAAKFGEGVFIDHGTGIVVGETAVVGNDVSMLHRVTLGGSGVQHEQRHPKIGNGVLIGAGACLLGNISVGKCTQIGAGSLVVEDLPERCVAVGVPAKVLGQGRQRKPALLMGQDFLKEVWRGSDI